MENFDFRIYLFAFSILTAGIGIIIWMVKKIIDEWWKMHREAMKEVSKVVTITQKIELTIVKMEGKFLKELSQIEAIAKQNQEGLKVAHNRIDKKCSS